MKRRQYIKNFIEKNVDKIDYNSIDKDIRHKFKDDLDNYLIVKNYRKIKKGDFIKYTDLYYSNLMGGVVAGFNTGYDGNINNFNMMKNPSEV